MPSYAAIAAVDAADATIGTIILILQTDEEIAVEQYGGGAVHVCGKVRLPEQLWRLLRRRGWAVAAIVIAATWGVLVSLSFAATTALWAAAG